MICSCESMIAGNHIQRLICYTRAAPPKDSHARSSGLACPPAGRPQLNKAPIQVTGPDIGRSCLSCNAVVLQFRREFRLFIIAYPDRIMIEARGVRGECRRYNEIALAHLEEECFTRRQVWSGSESWIPQKRRVEQTRIKLCRLGDVRYQKIDMVERLRLQ